MFIVTDRVESFSPPSSTKQRSQYQQANDLNSFLMGGTFGPFSFSVVLFVQQMRNPYKQDIVRKKKFWCEDAAENPLGGSRAQHTAAPAGCRPTQNLHFTIIMPNIKSVAQNFNFTHSFRVKVLYIYIFPKLPHQCAPSSMSYLLHTHTLHCVLQVWVEFSAVTCCVRGLHKLCAFSAKKTPQKHQKNRRDPFPLHKPQICTIIQT